MADSGGNSPQAGSGPAYEGGSGSTLVLLHGVGGTWPIWNPVIAMLERHHRVLAITLPGHHGGPALPDGVEPSVSSIADALLADLQARGLSHAHVAGNSLGGWLALELARRGFAQSVTAFSPAGGWKTAKDYKALARPFRILFALMPLIFFLTTAFLGFAWLRRALGKQTMEHGERVPARDFRETLVAMRNTRLLPALLTSMGRIGALKPFDAGATPIRIAWCEHDKVIPYARYGHHIVESVHGAELVTVTGVGHVPMYDDPEQIVANILAVTALAEPPKNAA